MSQINERTTVPLAWVAVMGAAVIGPVVAGSMWVKGVNDRLARIEEKLGIQARSAYTAGLVIEPAQAEDAIRLDGRPAELQSIGKGAKK